MSLDQLRSLCSDYKLPFWIWDRAQHAYSHKYHYGQCCFNHIIGLPVKNGKQMPLFDYERLIYDNLKKFKRLWIKKATGLGVTEFFLRFMAYLALCKNKTDFKQSTFAVVTGPRIDLAIDLISRFKTLFEQIGISFEDKNTVVNLASVKLEAFPSHHLDAMRGLPNVKFIFLDEADFFPKGQQQDARDVSERYIGKSDPYIVMVSTPNAPGGLFEQIEKEKSELSLYRRISLSYEVGLNKIYSKADIVQAKRSPSFEREYNLKYLGSIGNVFSNNDIDAAISAYDITQYDNTTVLPFLQGVMGIDPGWGSSDFGVVITHFVDGHVRTAFAQDYHRSDHSEMIGVIGDLVTKYNVTKILVDSSAPSFIRALKLQWGERSDYENIDKQLREYMKVEPVNFATEHKQLLYHVKFLLENKYLQIHNSFDKLIVSLRTAWAKEGDLDKEKTSYDDVLDAFRLCLRPYKEQQQ